MYVRRLEAWGLDEWEGTRLEAFSLLQERYLPFAAQGHQLQEQLLVMVMYIHHSALQQFGFNINECILTNGPYNEARPRERSDRGSFLPRG